MGLVVDCWCWVGECKEKENFVHGDIRAHSECQGGAMRW